MFEVNLPALSFTMVTVEEERDTAVNTTVVIFTEPGKISQNMRYEIFASFIMKLFFD